MRVRLSAFGGANSHQPNHLKPPRRIAYANTVAAHMDGNAVFQPPTQFRFLLPRRKQGAQTDSLLFGATFESKSASARRNAMRNRTRTENTRFNNIPNFGVREIRGVGGGIASHTFEVPALITLLPIGEFWHPCFPEIADMITSAACARD